MSKKVIIYKHPDSNAFDGPRLSGFLLDEMGQTAPIELPKDFVTFKKVKILNPDGTTSKLKFQKPQTKKKK